MFVKTVKTCSERRWVPECLHVKLLDVKLEWVLVRESSTPAHNDARLFGRGRIARMKTKYAISTRSCKRAAMVPGDPEWG
jgi:hypothetical protein